MLGELSESRPRPRDTVQSLSGELVGEVISSFAGSFTISSPDGLRRRLALDAVYRREGTRIILICGREGLGRYILAV